jgi:hypothetical protein
MPALILTAPILIGMVRTVLVALGIGFVTYVGLDTVLTYATNEITTNLGGIGPAAGLIGLAKIDQAIMFMISGYNVRLVMIVAKRFKLS